MIFWNKICAIFLIFSFTGIHLSAQTTIRFVRDDTNFNLKNKLIFLNYHVPVTTKIDKKTVPYYLKSPIPENFSTLSYGFFCRKELAIEKATKIPFRFRLGSLEQCNYYEGKRQ